MNKATGEHFSLTGNSMLFYLLNINDVFAVFTCINASNAVHQYRALKKDNILIPQLLKLELIYTRTEKLSGDLLVRVYLDKIAFNASKNLRLASTLPGMLTFVRCMFSLSFIIYKTFYVYSYQSTMIRHFSFGNVVGQLSRALLNGAHCRSRNQSRNSNMSRVRSRDWSRSSIRSKGSVEGPHSAPKSLLN